MKTPPRSAPESGVHAFGRRIARVLLSGALFGVGCVGCASVPEAPDSRAHARLVDALAEAEEATTSRVVETQIRWNPASCAAPGWQAFLYGRWERVAIEAAPDDARDSEDPVPARLRRLRTTASDDNGWIYPTFQFVALAP